MKLDKILEEALKAMDQAKVPEDLRSAALPALINLQARFKSVKYTDEQSKIDQKSKSAEETTISASLGKISKTLGIPLNRIDMIYDEHEDNLQVVADPADLGSTAKERAKSVALLLAGGRQLGGWDITTTPDSIIREELNRVGVYDPTNYSKHAKELTSWFNVNGSGKKATFKLKYQGRQALKEMTGQLASDE